jgi:GH25 family lysozyme M1 (1,4-beta-N-acetylmuramidase)
LRETADRDRPLVRRLFASARRIRCPVVEPSVRRAREARDAQTRRLAPRAAAGGRTRPGRGLRRAHGAGVRRDPASSVTTAAVLEGIDVSHWQGTITWSKVAAAGKKFAIIKASEDTDFVDDHYLANRSGAQAVGILTGAYHFARPDTSANDAVLEADHFWSTIRLGAGDLIPALDLEDSGGLSVTALQAWVTAFVNRVWTRTGVKPMIYTSPAFWSKYMGGTRALADAGFKLWIAHWGVTSRPSPGSTGVAAAGRSGSTRAAEPSTGSPVGWTSTGSTAPISPRLRTPSSASRRRPAARSSKAKRAPPRRSASSGRTSPHRWRSR